MSGPLAKVAAALDHIPERDGYGKPYPWARPFANLQALVKDIVTKLNATPWVASRTVSATFTAGQTQAISHGLGRTPTRWTTTDVTAAYSSFRRTAWDDTTITIQAENAATVSFLVE